MKRKISFFCILSFTSIFFMSCLSTKVETVDYKSRIEGSTPENSVIFYGCYTDNSLTYFAQSDSEYGPDFQKLEGSVFVSAPVKPGSRYRLAYTNGSRTIADTTYFWNDFYPMNSNSFDIKIPEEPGLYYVGTYDGMTSYEAGKNVPVQYFIFKKTPEQEEIACLKEVKRIYGKTEWKAVIDEKIKELSSK